MLKALKRELKRFSTMKWIKSELGEKKTLMLEEILCSVSGLLSC